jgi:hypothetical protein
VEAAPVGKSAFFEMFEGALEPFGLLDVRPVVRFESPHGAA